MSGYLYQAEWALVILLRAGRDNPSAAIRIEHLDDIEITTDSDGQTLIQVKSSIQGRPPGVINTSRDLWATLRVWADYVRTNSAPGYPEHFVLFTTAICAEGSAAAECRLAYVGNRPAALSALDTVANQDTSTTNVKNYAVWRSLSAAQRARIIGSMTVVDGNVQIDEVGEVIGRELFPSMHGDSGVSRLRDGVLGWWMGRIGRHIREHGSDEIRYEEVVNAARIRADDLAADALPLDEAVVAYAHELEGSDELKTFVRQLRLIRCGDGRVVRAISDYYRARSHIDNWLRNDLFPSERWRDYQQDLRDRWVRRRDEMLDELTAESASPDVEYAGRQLLNKTLNQQCPITRERPEEWLMTGTYHQLADEKRVGWHRDYDGAV